MEIADAIKAYNAKAKTDAKEQARREGYQYVIPFSKITPEELKCLKGAVVDGDKQVVYVPILEGKGEPEDWEFDESPDAMTE